MTQQLFPAMPLSGWRISLSAVSVDSLVEGDGVHGLLARQQEPAEELLWAHCRTNNGEMPLGRKTNFTGERKCVFD